MIEFNYRLKKYDENGNLMNEFVPNDIKSPLPTHCEIQAPNSSGKSTLLNIISIGLFGDENQYIHENLRKKMTELLDLNHNLLKYHFEIKNDSSNIKLVANKGDENSLDRDLFEYNILTGEKQPLSQELFLRKYKFIYDIPINPISRLDRLISNIESYQHKIKERLRDAKFFSGDLKKGIEDYKPEELEDAQIKLDDLEEQTLENDQKIQDIQETIKYLEKYIIFKDFMQSKERFEDLKLQQKNFSRKKKKITKIIKTKKLNENAQRIKIKRSQVDFENKRNQIIPFLRYLDIDKRLIGKWSAMNCEIFENLALPLDFINIQSKIIEEINSISLNKKTFEEIHLLRELIKILEKYDNDDFQIPGVAVGINNFISLLKDSLESKSKEEKKKNNIDKTNKLLKEVVILSNKIEKDIQTYKKNLSAMKTSANELVLIQEQEEDQDQRNLLKELKNAEKKFNESNKKYSFIGSPTGKEILDCTQFVEDQFPSYGIELLKTELKSKKNSLKEIIRRNKDLVSQKYHFEEKIKELSDIEKPEYLDSKKIINNLNQILITLEKRFSRTYPKFLKKIQNKQDATNEFENDYNSAIFRYLGHTIGDISHIDNKYEIDSIDLIRNIAYTKDDKQIFLNDMGTGQSQSTYLKSLLNCEDDKKIIALFDEISMMDKDSLNDVYMKVQELNKQKKILMAVFVQKNDDEIIIKEIL